MKRSIPALVLTVLMAVAAPADAKPLSGMISTDGSSSGYGARLCKGNGKRNMQPHRHHPGHPLISPTSICGREFAWVSMAVADCVRI